MDVLVVIGEGLLDLSSVQYWVHILIAYGKYSIMRTIRNTCSLTIRLIWMDIILSWIRTSFGIQINS